MKKFILITLTLSFGLFPLATLLKAQEETVDPETTLTLFGLIQQGGWFMVPLGLCSLAMFFLIFYAIRETQKTRFIPAGILESLGLALEERDLPKAAEMIDQKPAILTRSLRIALLKARPDLEDANKGAIETSLSECLEQEENNVGQWINYLNVVATVAPMIGLLGTVSGMIQAFQTIAGGGMGRPELLAGDIGEALVTTATGLIIGIPAMIAYFVLRNRLNNQMLSTAQEATTLIDRLAGEFPTYTEEESTET